VSREANAWGALVEQASELVRPDLAERVHTALRRRRAQSRACRIMLVSALVLTVGANAILLVIGRNPAPSSAERRAFLAERHELLRSL